MLRNMSEMDMEVWPFPVLGCVFIPLKSMGRTGIFYLHSVDVYGRCRLIYHTWSRWVFVYT